MTSTKPALCAEPTAPPVEDAVRAPAAPRAVGSSVPAAREWARESNPVRAKVIAEAAPDACGVDLATICLPAGPAPIASSPRHESSPPPQPAFDSRASVAAANLEASSQTESCAAGDGCVTTRNFSSEGPLAVAGSHSGGSAEVEDNAIKRESAKPHVEDGREERSDPNDLLRSCKLGGFSVGASDAIKVTNCSSDSSSSVLMDTYYSSEDISSVGTFAKKAANFNRNATIPARSGKPMVVIVISDEED
jgi:hypothetical protein